MRKPRKENIMDILKNYVLKSEHKRFKNNCKICGKKYPLEEFFIFFGYRKGNKGIFLCGKCFDLERIEEKI